MRYLQVLLALVFCSLVILWSLSSVSFENGKLFTTKISKEDIVSKEALKIQRDYPIDDCNNSLTIFDDDLYFHFHSSCEDTQTLDEISNQFKSILEKHFDKKKLSKFKIVSIELQNKYFHNVHFIRYDNTIKHDAFILDVRRYYNDNCLVPYSYGMIYNQLMEANLWEIYCTLMPRQRHESEKRYENLKRASLS